MPTLFESVREPIDDKPVELLSELFYERFFFNDLISSHDDAQLASANMLAMLGFPGLLCLYWVPKYLVQLRTAPDAVLALNVLGDRFFWLTFEMAVLGLVTTLQWERLFPDHRDYAILGPQPIPMHVLFEAQARALGRFVGLHLAIGNIGAALFFPVAAIPWSTGLLPALGFAIGHWLSLIATALFVVLVVAALQGVLANLLTPAAFERVSPVAQGLLMAVFLGMIVLLPLLQSRALAGVEQVGMILEQNPAAWCFPPLWFAALGEFVAGRGVGGLAPLALLAFVSLVLTVALAIGSYLLSYSRFLRRSLESPRGGRINETRLGTWSASLLRRAWLRDALERAVFLFALKTLLRSRQHRLYLGAFVAVGAAVVIAQTWALHLPEAPTHILLTQPYVLLFLALAGMRVVFEFPAELNANWAFRFHATPEIQRYMAGTRKAIWMLGPAPLLIATTLGILTLWGAPAAGAHLLLLATCSWVSIEVMLARFAKIPFTCNHVSGRAHVIILWTFCAVGMLVYSATLASIELWAFKRVLHVVLLAIGAGALAVIWKRLQPQFAPDPAGPIFHETSDPVVHRLNLYDE